MIEISDHIYTMPCNIIVIPNLIRIHIQAFRFSRNNYNMSDFVNWDDSDMDLSVLLGEYTEYEVDRNSDSTSDDCHSKVQKTGENRRPGKTFAALYRCPLCSKDYGSISGFRGHVIKAHGRSDLRAPDYKLTSETQQTIPTTPPTLTSSSNQVFFSTEQLQGCMLESVRNSLNAIAHNEIHKSDLACEGKMCDIASLLSGSESCLAQITDHLTPTFVTLFSGLGKSSSFVASREQMWAQFHRVRTDTKFCDQLHDVIKLHTQESDWNVHMLSQCLLDELVDAVCTKFISSIQSDAEHEAKDLTSAENETLFYICGFLIRAITKHSGIESKVAKTLRHLCITSQDTSSAFMTKFRVWTETVNRGGLKVSGDNFFFLVRKMEIICRHQVDTSNLNANSLCVDRLKDSILKDTTVLFYWDKLVTSSEEEKLSILESIADLFLKLRGRAVVQHIRRQTQKRNASTPKRAKKGKKSNSLRKRLREH
ncbi:uncharacterized protein [Haliotis cracherodii]|uniref:uncharacterized protein n=1 Tax=Haliotis cracherodii TaxID=6455 RepID=UPI0039EA4B0D